MRQMSIAVLVLLIALPVAFAQSRLDPDYVHGYELWRARDYRGASDNLKRYRNSQRYAQSYDVDYWLGTSWCRIAGVEAAGVDLLDWGFQFAQMPPAARQQYRTERDACLQFLRDRTAVRTLPGIVLAAALAPATSRAAGKIYYIAGGDEGGLAAYTLRVKRPLPPEEYDARLVKLTDEAKAMQGVRERAAGFRVVRHGPFMLASASRGHTPEVLEEIGRRLDHYISFLVAEYGLKMPDYFYTVYLVPDIYHLRAFAERVHGLDASPATLGYAFQNDLSFVAVLEGTAIGTLMHELFHLAVRSSYGAIPQWLDEGIASLYETSTVDGGRYWGEPNWRSKVVNVLWREYPNVRVSSVITTPWFGDEPGDANEKLSAEQALTLALSRYFVMYLQEQGNLRKVFAAFRDRKAPLVYVPAERQAVQLLERATGRSVADLDHDFFSWYRRVGEYPDSRLHAGRPETREKAPGSPYGQGADTALDREEPGGRSVLSKHALDEITEVTSP